MQQIHGIIPHMLVCQAHPVVHRLLNFVKFVLIHVFTGVIIQTYCRILYWNLAITLKDVLTEKSLSIGCRNTLAFMESVSVALCLESLPKQSRTHWTLSGSVCKCRVLKPADWAWVKHQNIHQCPTALAKYFELKATRASSKELCQAAWRLHYQPCSTFNCMKYSNRKFLKWGMSEVDCCAESFDEHFKMKIQHSSLKTFMTWKFVILFAIVLSLVINRTVFAISNY